MKQVFVTLLSFSISLPTKIDLNLAELNYYPFMISIDKYNGSCKVVDDL